MKKSYVAGAFALAFAATPALADISVNVGAIGVMPSDSSSSLNVVEQLAGLTAGSTGVNVNTNTQLGLTFDYKVSPEWTVELIAATPFSHDIYANGALAGLKVGKTKHLPPTLMAQYHFPMSSDRFDPFVGVGVNYTWFFSEKVDGALVSALEGLGATTPADDISLALKNSWGYALQAGVNVKLDERWGLHFMVSKMDIDTVGSVKVNGATVQTVDVSIDPVVAMAGIRYTF
jgi:outer membrane protein